MLNQLKLLSTFQCRQQQKTVHIEAAHCFIRHDSKIPLKNAKNRVFSDKKIRTSIWQEN